MSDLNIEVFKPDPRPKLFLYGPLGNADVNGLVLTLEEANELVEILTNAITEAELS
jgi:hypothetical protein